MTYPNQLTRFSHLSILYLTRSNLISFFLSCKSHICSWCAFPPCICIQYLNEVITAPCKVCLCASEGAGALGWGWVPGNTLVCVSSAFSLTVPACINYYAKALSLFFVPLTPRQLLWCLPSWGRGTGAKTLMRNWYRWAGTWTPHVALCSCGRE